VYILHKEGLPDIAAALETLGLEREVAEKIVENGSVAASVLDFHLCNSTNRGYDSSGIVTFDGQSNQTHRDLGSAEEVYHHDDPEKHRKTLEQLVGNIAIGQNRYRTSGIIDTDSVQPFEPIDGITIAHNGNIVNQIDLRRFFSDPFVQKKVPLLSTSDSELIRNSLVASYGSKIPIDELVRKAMIEDREFIGAYSVVALIRDQLIAFRDPRAYWPLHMARLGNLIIFNSEVTPIQEFIRATDYKLRRSDFLRSVERGDIETVSNRTITTYTRALMEDGVEVKKRRCTMDYIYLLMHKNELVMHFRKRSGEILWEHYGLSGDKEEFVVSPVPQSGTFYAHGIRDASGLHYKRIIEKRSKTHKAFLAATPEERLAMKEKKYRLRETYKGMKVMLTDDSVVRNDTLYFLIKKMRLKEVEELHLRIGSPPIKTPCYNGMSTPTRNELLAHHLNRGQIEMYFESIFYGADYDRDTIISKIKKGKTVENIVQDSVIDNQNYLKDPKMREVEKGKFSLKYNTLKMLKSAFKRADLNPDTRCYACMMPGWSGYPNKFKPYLSGLSKAA
tara:strand:- start:24701 stop:26383 length:1683 start_codon:yes stop_codon:yes gene_type:complete